MNVPKTNTTLKVSMSAPDITPEEINAVVEVLQSGWLSLGPKIKAFEHQFAEYIGISQAIGVSSGTAGLHLAMIAAGIGVGDEVITPSFSFIASANCIVYERGTPVFVDVDPQTGNLDPQAVRDAITPRTKAIVAVHAFGQPADMDALQAIAREHELWLIEDACEAIGAEYKGRKAGTLGDVGIFAFYPNKQMTTGEGGMLVTDKQDWANLFDSLRNQGRDIFDEWLNHSRLGYNYRLDEMSAVLGLVQLQRIEELLQKRAQVASWYNARLQAVEDVQIPQIHPHTTRMSWFVYVIQTPYRDTLLAKLKAKGIPSRPYFTPIHQQPYYQQLVGDQSARLPNTEHLGKVSLALPFSSIMTQAEVNYVCDQLQACLVECREDASH
jgi:perosamine synthetase